MTRAATRRRIAAPRLRTRTGAQLGVRRIRWLLVIYLIAMIAVVGKLVEIQVVNADEYADIGVRQRARTVDLPATRGRIYDREGDVLATSVQAATIYGDPRRFRAGETPDGTPLPPAADADETAAALAPLLGLEVEVLADRLERDAHFVYLARQLDHEVGAAVAELGLPGIGVLTEPRRVYPAGGLAAQVVGFTGIDGDGLQGLESRYDPILSGSSGMLVFERAPGGLDIASGVRELVPPEVGTDLVLTIDREIQHAAERAADQVMADYGAIGASVVVLEVGTGDVLAMASTPGYDPNDRGDEDPANRRNRAVTDIFEPGSTQKALTVAAALEEGLVSAGTVLEVPDAIQVGGSRFSDAYDHPTERWDVTEIMERSSNVGTIQIAQQLGPERLDRYLRDFGYGRPTGGAFPGEVGGMLMPHEQWWGTSLPTISIGQGVAVTLLQLADAYHTLANDGVSVDPRVVRGTVGDDGRLRPASVSDGRQVVSAQTAATVRDMLEVAVVGEHATGPRAQIEGWRVGGKTGTARKPAADARGYSEEYMATFVGMAPIDDPRVVVAVMVDEPRPFFGGIVAAPVFAEVAEAAMIALKVPPSNAGQDLRTAMEAARLRAADAELAAQAASQEGDAVDPEEPTSPPVGDPTGSTG
ncbi:MAG: penicillin-binding protein 2 [Nitriliruptoraceae bacterium]|nr:penicillin-binding protein 2 [Nitriliruptoraceae bacterium]